MPWNRDILNDDLLAPWLAVRLEVTASDLHSIGPPEEVAVLLKNRCDPHLGLLCGDPDLLPNQLVVGWDPVALRHAVGVKGAAARDDTK